LGVYCTGLDFGGWIHQSRHMGDWRKIMNCEL